MNATATTRRFSLYTVVSIIVNGFMLMAAGISYSHIVQTSVRLGIADWQAYIVPLFIDGLAVLGMIGRSDAMAAQLRARNRTEAEIAAVKSFGFKLQFGAGALSLAANFYAGETLGAQLLGILIVGGFVITEKYAEKLRGMGATIAATEAAPALTADDMQAYADAAVAAALAQAALDTQAAVDAALAKADRARRAKERRDAKRLAEIAPVSPGIDGVFDPERGYATSAAYEPAYL